MKSLSNFVWVAVAALSVGASWAQQSGPAAPAPAPSTSVSNREPGSTAVTQAAVQQGILQCAARVEQLSRFIGFANTTQAGALLVAPAPPVDQRLFSVAIELPAGAVGNSLVDISFAPNQANGCGATYQAVSYWTQSCEALALSQFASFKKNRPLQQDVMVLDGGPATKVFLMKAGDSGCVSIKKEIVL